MTAIFIGTLISCAFFIEACTTACACAVVKSPGSVLVSLAEKTGALNAKAHNNATDFEPRIICLLGL